MQKKNVQRFSVGENLEENLRSENLRVDEVIILTLWRRNYFFLILAHPVYKM